MEDKQLNAAESLELIGRMIENTRNRMERNSGRPFLIWGYTTVVITLAVWLAVWKTQDLYWNWLWFGLPLMGGLLMWLTRPRNNQGSVRTFVDRVIDKIWLVLGSALMFCALISMTGISRPPMLFLSVLMMGAGTTLTGLVIRFTPSTVGGALGIVLSPVLIAPWGEWQAVVFIAAFVVMMVIPGHVLNYRSNHPKK